MILDLRKAADYEASHILTSVSADVDAAIVADSMDIDNEGNVAAMANIAAAAI